MKLEWEDLTGIGSLRTSASSSTSSLLLPGLSEGDGFVGWRSADVIKLWWKAMVKRMRSGNAGNSFVCDQSAYLTSLCDIYEHFKKWRFGWTIDLNQYKLSKSYMECQCVEVRVQSSGCCKFTSRSVSDPQSRFRIEHVLPFILMLWITLE